MDTSASVDDRTLALVYGELSAALEQFGGTLRGSLGFFDTRLVPPRPFSTVEELASIRPRGGGGTDYRCVLDALRRQRPDSLVIVTDGEGVFPPEPPPSAVPVLWLFTQTAAPPPWGRSACLPPPSP